MIETMPTNPFCSLSPLLYNTYILDALKRYLEDMEGDVYETCIEKQAPKKGKKDGASLLEKFSASGRASQPVGRPFPREYGPCLLSVVVKKFFFLFSLPFFAKQTMLSVHSFLCTGLRR